jgi:uncharacterized membrane protein
LAPEALQRPETEIVPATLGGLPLHPLLVHAVVVLVPLAVVAAVAMAVSSTVRARYGWLFVGLATLALGSVPLATSSGEALQSRVQETAAIERHTHMGDQLLPLVGLLWVAVVVMILAHRWGSLPADGPGTPGASASRPAFLAPVDRVGHAMSPRRRRLIGIVAAALAVVMAVATGIQVYRIGDSGARAVWHGVGTGPAQQGGDGDTDGD